MLGSNQLQKKTSSEAVEIRGTMWCCATCSVVLFYCMCHSSVYKH